MGGAALPARRPACLQRDARDAVLPRRGLRAVLGRRVRAPLRGLPREAARARAGLRDRAGRPEPLELRRRRPLAQRPLGVACARRLPRRAARGRADARVRDGRHARRSGAPRGRRRRLRRPREPQRPLRRGDRRAPPRAGPGARPDRAARDRRSPRGLPPRQSVRGPPPGVPGGGARLHEGDPARADVGEERGGDRALPRLGSALQPGDGRDRRARRTRCHRGGAAGCGGRGDPRGRWGHRLPDHRLDLDERAGAGLRQPATVPPRAPARAT